MILKFKDNCTISRAGALDEWEEPTMVSVYSGACSYQEKATAYVDGMILRTPVVFLPSNDVEIQINDQIVITTEVGRSIIATANSIRDVRMPSFGISYTRIELKRAKGD